jgi:hypothetical protein
MSSRAKIVHMIPRGVLENTYHGSFKDVISRVRLFERCQADYRQVILNGDEPESLHSQWGDWEKSSFLIEYSYYPRIVRALRKRFPDSFIAVRSHNIEPLQHLHNHGWWPARGPLWVGYGITRLLWGDIIVKRHADVIYSISDWERTQYWQRLPGMATTKWLPYYCPAHLIGADCTATAERNLIVCMPTSVKSRKSQDLVNGFISFAELAQKHGTNFEFLITGDLSSWPAPQSPAVKYTGMIEDIAQFFCSVKAVCILSDLGYGFKTTIADAMANGVAVLVHDKLKRRFSSMLGDSLISVDSLSEQSVMAILHTLQQPQCSQVKLHNQFRLLANDILSRDFLLDRMP